MYDQDEKRLRTDLRRKMELERVSSLRPLLKELDGGSLNFMCLQYIDSNGVQQLVPAVLLGSIDSFNGAQLKELVDILYPGLISFFRFFE